MLDGFNVYIANNTRREIRVYKSPECLSIWHLVSEVIITIYTEWTWFICTIHLSVSNNSIRSSHAYGWFLQDHIFVQSNIRSWCEVIKKQKILLPCRYTRSSVKAYIKFKFVAWASLGPLFWWTPTTSSIFNARCSNQLAKLHYIDGHASKMAIPFFKYCLQGPFSFRPQHQPVMDIN